jgi:hypothetical protein
MRGEAFQVQQDIASSNQAGVTEVLSDLAQSVCPSMGIDP